MDRNFTIALPITRAYKKSDGTLWIEGIASSTEVDTYETIFNANCQEGFAFDISTGAGTDEPVELEAEHKGSEEPMNILGPIMEARITKQKELYISAMLDSENPKAVYYYNILSNPDPKLGRPKKLGLSINGYVVDAHYEYSNELQKEIRVFDRVKLEKVGIVREPSNPSTWVGKLVRNYDWQLVQKENTMEVNTALENEVRNDSPEVTEEVVTPEVTEEVVETTEVTEVASDEVSSEETTSEVAEVVEVQEETEVTQVEEETVRGLSAEEVDAKISEATYSIKVDISSEVMDSIESALTEFRSKVEELITASETKVEELSRKLADAETKNNDLSERLERMEAIPTSTPGGQMISGEAVARSLTDEEKKAEAYRNAIKRAKETGDRTALTKLILFPGAFEA